MNMIMTVFMLMTMMMRRCPKSDGCSPGQPGVHNPTMRKISFIVKMIKRAKSKKIMEFPPKSGCKTITDVTI